MLLSVNNVSNWDHHLKMKLTAFPDVGSAIRKGTPFVLLPSTVNDLIGENLFRKYYFQIDHPADLTESSLNIFLKAQAAFKTRIAVMEKRKFVT